MFLLGFIVGVISATLFILYGNGELLIRLADKIRAVSDRFWESQKKSKKVNPRTE